MDVKRVTWHVMMSYYELPLSGVGYWLLLAIGRWKCVRCTEPQREGRRDEKRGRNWCRYAPSLDVCPHFRPTFIVTRSGNMSACGEVGWRVMQGRETGATRPRDEDTHGSPIERRDAFYFHIDAANIGAVIGLYCHLPLANIKQIAVICFYYFWATVLKNWKFDLCYNNVFR